jgi:hypothetical protein
MKPRVSTVVLVVALAMLLLAACAPGVNQQIGSVDQAGVVAGFWRGVWHGLIAPITFVVSLFRSDVRIYEVHNSGGWYDFGYVLGLSIVFGGTHAGRRAQRRREKVR